jgi:hypothetical protein
VELRAPPFRDEVDVSTLFVLAVARLGENDQAGWWGCHGLSSTGRYILSSSFPRTWAPAALELDISSATRRHDELLARETALHLFSDQLPFRRLALAWLAERKTAGPSALMLCVLVRSGDLLEEVAAEWIISPAH